MFNAQLRRRLRCIWAPSVFSGSFFAALISAWPMILHWDLLSQPELAPYKGIFFLLYAFYMLAFGFVATFGLFASIALLERFRRPDAMARLIHLKDLTSSGALWVVNSGIATFVLDRLGKP